MSKQRIEYIDLAKGFCILLVVIYHVFVYYDIKMPLNNFFKAFRLPLYFFLSGMFFKEYDGFLNFAKRKTNKLIIPFVFWFLLLSVFCNRVFAHFAINIWGTSSCAFQDSLTNWITKEDFPNSPIWFLLCLFEVNIIFYLCQLFAKQTCGKALFLILFSFVSGCVGILLSKLGINLPIYIDSAFTALPFFMFGYIITRYTDLLKPQKWDIYLPLISALLFFLVYLFAPFYSLKYNRLGSIISVLEIYPCGLLGTMGVIFLAKFFKRIPVIVWWGRYSIMILVVHKFVIYLLGYLLSDASISLYTQLVINFMATMCVCSIFIPVFKKYLPHVTAQKDLIKV